MALRYLMMIKKVRRKFRSYIENCSTLYSKKTYYSPQDDFLGNCGAKKNYNNA